MKKIIQIVKKQDNVLVILFFILSIMAKVLFVKFEAGDELWNFSNVYKMANGFTIYKDINVIITPLFFYIGEIFLKLLGMNYFAFKIYAILINVSLFFLIYQLFKVLKVEKINAFLYSLLVYAGYRTTIGVGANYNNLALIFCLLGIIALLKKTKHGNLIQGVILFIVFMTKQNIGVYYFVGLVLYQIFLSATKKEKLKAILTQGTIAGILTLGFLILLQSKGILFDFINYTVLGMKEFAMKNFAIGNITNIASIVGLIILLCYVIRVIRNKKNKEKFEKEMIEKVTILFCFAIPLMGISYPIFNIAHIILCYTVPTILMLYIVDTTIVKQILNHKVKEIIKYVTIFGAIVISLWSIVIIYQYQGRTKEYDFDEQNVYNGAIIPEEMSQEIKEVLAYIEDENSQAKEVKIISYYSNVYMNLLNKNNEKLDLPFLGNLGNKGEDGLIEEIDQLENTNILILKDGIELYQESEKVRNYIRDNFIRKGDVTIFEIYQKE